MPGRSNIWNRLCKLEQLLNQGLIIDEADFDMLLGYSWTISKKGYVRTNVWHNGVTVNWKLHQLLLGNPPPGMVSDHRNRNKLDNRRANLRFVTHSDSNINRGMVERAFNIRPKEGCYEICVRRNNRITYEYRNTLEEAVAVRDSLR